MDIETIRKKLYYIPGRGYLSGDTSAMGDVGESPGESCLFSLTPSADPGIGLSGDRLSDRALPLRNGYLSGDTGLLELDYWNGLELDYWEQ